MAPYLLAWKEKLLLETLCCRLAHRTKKRARMMKALKRTTSREKVTVVMSFLTVSTGSS